MPIYVVRTGDTGLHLVGPFADADAACAWATGPCEPDALNSAGSAGVNNPNDDPRWQTVELNQKGAEHTFTLDVVNPDNLAGAAELATVQGYGASR